MRNIAIPMQPEWNTIFSMATEITNAKHEKNQSYLNIWKTCNLQHCYHHANSLKKTYQFSGKKHFKDIYTNKSQLALQGKQNPATNTVKKQR